ncbi:hypothetical protein MBRA1_000781 [Malassezia brasiliensis]|uniref:Uncharacterized protein n=1 Tax=Malassezia brasiliensis TaxID=1821822 RepID=A0AAF0DUE8_9BASI|nr:hypothetical protein MBRA1_000781 [Malassezia brasiliensis]
MPVGVLPTRSVAYARRQQSVATVVETSTLSSPGPREALTSYVTSTAPVQTPSQTPQPPQKQTAAGPVAGGVVGGVVGLALLIAIAYMLIRRARNRRATRALDSAYAEAGVGGGGVDRRMRMRPAQTDEAWIPMSHSDLDPAMRESHSGQQSLGRSEPYFASPVHQPFMQDMEIGMQPHSTKMPSAMSPSNSNWTEYQPGPAAQQMRQFQDEVPLASHAPSGMPNEAPPVPIDVTQPTSARTSSRAETRSVKSGLAPAPTVADVPVASSDAYSDPYADVSAYPAYNPTDGPTPAAPTVPVSTENVPDAPVSPAAVQPVVSSSDTYAPAPKTPPSGAAPPISSDTLARAPSAIPTHTSLNRMTTDSLEYEDGGTELQSPSSAYMWLPSHRFADREGSTVSRMGTGASYRTLARSDSVRQESAEEQEIGNKLWRTTGKLRVANES